MREYNVSPFEGLKRLDDGGCEYWSAKELMRYAGYYRWVGFKRLIQRVAQRSGLDSSHHFVLVKEARSSDYHLSRHACHLLFMNGDTNKKQIVQAQIYFSTRTKEAELNQSKVTGIEFKEEMQKFLDGGIQRLEKKIDALTMSINPTLHLEVSGLSRSIADLERELESRLQQVELNLKSVENAVSCFDKPKAEPDEETRLILPRVLQKTGGMCPCCGKHQIMNVLEGRLILKNGRTYAEYDHFHSKERSDIKNFWLICQPCNVFLHKPGSDRRTESCRKKFDAFQVWVDDLRAQRIVDYSVVAVARRRREAQKVAQDSTLDLFGSSLS